MKKIEDYMILAVRFDNFKDAVKELEKGVSNRISEGFEPLGGVTINECIGNGTMHTTLAQAMIKYKTVEVEEL